MAKATGAQALLGVVIDAPSDTYSIGRAGVDLNVATAPSTAPTTAAGTSGNLTGSFYYRVGYGQKNGAMTGPAWSATATAAPVGTPGLSDFHEVGSFTGSGVHTWDVIIDSTGTPDTFKWRKDGGAWTAGVACTLVGLPVTLSDGITVYFGATTGHTLGDAFQVTTGVISTVLTVSAKRILLTVIPTRSPNVIGAIDRRIIERSQDAGVTWAIAGVLYDNTATTFTDNVATLDASKTLPSINQTGSNYGITCLEVDSFDLDPEFSYLKVMALLGTAGTPRSIPGPIKTAGSPKADMRPCELFPTILAGAGLPDSYVQVTGEPTQIATWNATTGKRNPRTISFFGYDGSSAVNPNFLYEMACSELDFAFSGGKIDMITPKFEGANYGLSAPAVPVVQTGTYRGSFVALGQRYDANALVNSVFIKITDVLSANTVKFTVSVDTHASAGGGSYSAAKFTLYRNATSLNQTKGGLQYNDSIEITDQSGNYLGADVGSNRQPFTIVATAPFDTGDFLVNDIYEILPTAAIPGAGSSPYSGVPARFAQGPRFTDAHVTIVQDGNVVECTAGSVKFTWPKKSVNALCAGARTVIDLPNEGFFGVALTLTRFLDSSTYRQIIRTDARASIVVKLEGARIPVNPGVVSTYREALYITLPQVVFDTVKAPITGQVLVVETLTASAEQPDNPSLDLYNLVLQTAQGYRIPS